MTATEQRAHALLIHRTALRHAALLVCLTSCSRPTPPEPAAERQVATPAPAPVIDPSFRLPAPERLVAFGDVHGDLDATRAALRLAGAIDGDNHWKGGKLVVVQTGDQLDRGDDEAEILDFFDRLRDEARAAGGAFHALNGNHEIMNVVADFRYVTPRGFHTWGGVKAEGPRQSLIERLPEEQRGRAAAFLPGGPVAKRLAERPVVLAVGDSVFVHGGLLEEHVRYGLSRLNDEARRWMLGERAQPPRLLQSEDGPVWSREYSDKLPTAAQCETLARTLKLLDVKRLVVGHTVQKNGINSACGGKVWRIDVGLAKFYGGTPSVLEIAGDRTQVIALPPAAAMSAEVPAPAVSREKTRRAPPPRSGPPAAGPPATL